MKGSDDDDDAGQTRESGRGACVLKRQAGRQLVTTCQEASCAASRGIARTAKALVETRFRAA